LSYENRIYQKNESDLLTPGYVLVHMQLELSLPALSKASLKAKIARDCISKNGSQVLIVAILGALDG
jgi:hypothetical protein